ncbi:hypothetical protein KUC_3762 [Vreelandella boliviensis LC1]|uniref:Uncharacterized protein n=1 Tax=Vreelandella boliviensis LC1 TaxID=1072583 RepID=A0A7U9GER4_9GAMM|nr:hypothetical protein KUC_3762 [Halomonas boliviensis LC1]
MALLINRKARSLSNVLWRYSTMFDNVLETLFSNYGSSK